jgi:hypothetical protein
VLYSQYAPVYPDEAEQEQRAEVEPGGGQNVALFAHHTPLSPGQENQLVVVLTHENGSAAF